MERIKIGLIGFGRMGEKYLSQLRASGKWEVAYICDVSPGAQAYAREICPGTCITGDEDVVFNDPEVRVVGLFTLADSRYRQIRKAVEKGKHILAEKPIADTLEHEKELVDLVESSSLLSAVNLYLRNSWYHNCIKDFISSGEIGDLAIIRIFHMTPGLAPGEGHEFEGPSFHDCGMHYVDLARWYAGSDFPIPGCPGGSGSHGEDHPVRRPRGSGFRAQGNLELLSERHGSISGVERDPRQDEKALLRPSFPIEPAPSELPRLHGRGRKAD